MIKSKMPNDLLFTVSDFIKITNEVNIIIYRTNHAIENAFDGGVNRGLFNVLYQSKFIILLFQILWLNKLVMRVVLKIQLD